MIKGYDAPDAVCCLEKIIGVWPAQIHFCSILSRAVLSPVLLRRQVV